jgi:hypothetical protein
MVGGTTRSLTATHWRIFMLLPSPDRS